MGRVSDPLLRDPPGGGVQPPGTGPRPRGTETQRPPLEALLHVQLWRHLPHDVSLGFTCAKNLQVTSQCSHLTSDLGVGYRGAGFSFLFSWILMIVVLVLFLVGGNGYTLFCKPLKSGELIKVVSYSSVSCIPVHMR